MWNNKTNDILAQIAGSILICIWTLLRFFTQKTIYDHVSQQVIVHQWLHSGITSAHMGQTAYVPKMLLLYVPLDLLPGSPRLKLIVSTLVINVVAFLLIATLIKVIIRMFGVREGKSYQIGLIWLAAIAGSVFWVGFINSRNIEVAGGLFLIYLALRYMHGLTKRNILLFIAFAGVLFFADPLQFYMTCIPILVYVGVLCLLRRQTWQKFLGLLGIFAAGFMISKILFALVHHFLSLSFSETGGLGLLHITPSWIAASIKGLVISYLTLFAGGTDAGMPREIVNLVFVLAVVLLISYSIWKRHVPRSLMLLVVCIFVVNIGVYILSGQAAQPATSRYLIMTVPAILLAFSSVRMPKKARIPAAVLVALMVITNVTFLTGSLVKNWNTHFTQDAHLESVYAYAKSASGMQVYASIDSGVPLVYYRSDSVKSVLPVGCLDGSLTRTYYAMDKEFQNNKSSTVAIVLDGNQITNAPNICNEATLTAAYGKPLRHETTDDGSQVLIYQQDLLRLR